MWLVTIPDFYCFMNVCQSVTGHSGLAPFKLLILVGAWEREGLLQHCRSRRKLRSAYLQWDRSVGAPMLRNESCRSLQICLWETAPSSKPFVLALRSTKRSSRPTMERTLPMWEWGRVCSQHTGKQWNHGATEDRHSGVWLLRQPIVKHRWTSMWILSQQEVWSWLWKIPPGTSLGRNLESAMRTSSRPSVVSTKNPFHQALCTVLHLGGHTYCEGWSQRTVYWSLQLPPAKGHPDWCSDQSHPVLQTAGGDSEPLPGSYSLVTLG